MQDQLDPESARTAQRSQYQRGRMPMLQLGQSLELPVCGALTGQFD